VTHERAQEVAAALSGITKLVLQTCSPPFEQLAALLKVAQIRAVQMGGVGGHLLIHSGGNGYSRLLYNHLLETLILAGRTMIACCPPPQPPTSIHLRTLQLPRLALEYTTGATLLNHLLSAPNLRHLQVGKQ
jgi:hypothetical protein